MPGAKLRKNACNGHGWQLTDLMPELRTLQELQELQELRELQQLWEALSDIWPRSELCRQLIVWQRLFTAWLEVLLIVLPLPVHKLLTGINDGWPFQKWLESPICIIITLPSHPVWPRCPLRTVNFTMMYLSLSQVNPYTVICLIEAPGAIARLNLIPWSKNWGSELSNGGFGLKIGQILRKLSLFQSLSKILGPPY